ncbi:hypothetical protein RHSIM_Rhsim05G0198300 [Rhododendron simsii]|uniref:CASP-like protein n=1 Tax=Rhododendron simsii TaxID=118357 RepID=A0A834GZE9_RHOSS|nr:hypothetical protein RHSIM_Rhsim05G0198300 [Rhododendron simsii]
MKELLGSPGTVSGLTLRIGQCLFAGASIGVMVSALGFSSYTAFCYLIASMGLQVLWSFGLACLDVYALRIKRDLHNPVLVSLFVVGDWVCNIFLKLSSNMQKHFHTDDRNTLEVLVSRAAVVIQIFALLLNSHTDLRITLEVTATLSLAAACSSAGIAVFYARDLNFCKAQMHLPCNRFQLSVALAFITWFLVAVSSHVMFWILASV